MGKIPAKILTFDICLSDKLMNEIKLRITCANANANVSRLFRLFCLLIRQGYRLKSKVES